MTAAELPSTADLGRYLVVIALFGAAHQDADPKRVELLREIADMLKEPAADRPLDDIVRRVFEVMGPGWIPTGEFGAWIDELIAERDRGEWTPGNAVRRAT